MRRPTFLLSSLVLFYLLILLPDASISHTETLDNGCTPVPVGIVGWWPGDGNANDAADGNHGIAGPDTTYASGKIGPAFSLNGNTNYIKIPDNGLGVPLDGFGQLTIEAWIKPNSIGWPEPESSGHISAIVSKHDTTKTDGVSYSLLQFNGKLRLVVVQNLYPDNAIGALSNLDIPINSWSHVVGVWRGGTDVELYLNGSEIAGTIFSEGTTPTSTANNNVPVNIGRIESFSGTHVGPAAFFDGLIDEASIYNRALSSQEIQAIYNAGSNGKCNNSEFKVTYLPLVEKPRLRIFSDDFSNPFSGWSIVDRQHDRFQYVDGEYEILLRTFGRWAAASAPVDDIDNYSIGADMRLHSDYSPTDVDPFYDDTISYGLIFERVDWDNFYLFVVLPETQQYTLHRRNPTWQRLIDFTYSTAIKPGTAANHLEVTRIGDEIILLVNGVKLESITDSSLIGIYREVGLYMGSFEIVPIAVRFDNFIVWQEGSAITSANLLEVDWSTESWWISRPYSVASRKE